MRYEYATQDVCAQCISFELDGNVVRSIEFYGGCSGNLRAISKLLEASTVEDIERKLLGNRCGRRPTSCADQLAKAVRLAYDDAEAKE